MRCDHCPRKPGGICRGEGVPRLCELALAREDYREFLAGEGGEPSPITVGPRVRERPAEPPPPGPPGVGDHFAAIVGWLGFEPTEACACNAIRLEMNRLGPLGCEAKSGLILDQVFENALAMKFFEGPIGLASRAGFRPAASKILRIAIGRARKGLPLYRWIDGKGGSATADAAGAGEAEAGMA